MVKTGKIAQYRQKLDQTLASHDLIDQNKLEALVKDHILRSSDDKSIGYIDNVIEKRTTEVSDFLQMLRSASENYDISSDKTQHASWKLKQDNEDFRVMYREGPVGSPFHSLLVEGYIDAPLDVCLCVSWEVPLYQRWFPEMVLPTFKVVVAKTLQKIRIGEEISLVRIKLSWPLSTREVLLHYFEFEYLEDDLVVVLINSISDVADIQMETHGFTSEGIPDAGNTVRMGLVGGFALQKVSDNRSYFRTIGNMDIKLDFVPPSLINFISRQLVGTGFRVYQKIVASMTKGDEDYGKALDDPLYKRIHEALLSNTKSKRHLETQTIDEGQTSNEIEEENIEETLDRKCQTLGDKVEDHKVIENGHVNGYSIRYKPCTEIEEEDIKENDIGDAKEGVNSTTVELVSETSLKKVQISPEVEQALGTLDKVIASVREGKLKASLVNEANGSTTEKHVKWEDNMDFLAEGRAQNENALDFSRSADPYFQPRVPNHPGISLEGNSPAFVSPLAMETNGIYENNLIENKKSAKPKKWRSCCLHIISGRFLIYNRKKENTKI